MFYYLDGVVSLLENNIAVIDCAGIGFECNITAYTRASLKEGTRSKLFTYCNIREDGFDIFGFYTKIEKSCFEMLIGVSGVGPKAALSILSYNTPENFAAAIINNNEKALTSAPGIGKKIAQRVILELKDKISKEAALISDNVFMNNDQVIGINKSGKAADAAAALSVLGYSQTDIAYALKGIDIESMSLEDIVRSALKQMLK